MSNTRSPLQYKGVRAIRPPDLTIAQRAPTATDTAYLPGQLWLDQADLTSFQFSGTSWIALGTGAVGGVVTITGDSGGPESPTAGNFNLLGTANQITVTGTANTETFKLSSTLVAPGSIVATTSIASTTTLTGGTGITATTGNIVASAGNITTTVGSITSATTLTATLGAITATNGNMVFGTAGNKTIYSSVASTTTAGANSAGKVTLSGGTATVSTTAVTASSIIRLYRQGVGATGAAALGELSVGTISAGASFIINAWQQANATALATTDVSSIGWEIVN